MERMVYPCQLVAAGYVHLTLFIPETRYSLLYRRAWVTAVGQNTYKRGPFSEALQNVSSPFFTTIRSNQNPIAIWAKQVLKPRFSRSSYDRSSNVILTLCRTYALNRGHARDIPEGACKHWSVPKLRACKVNGDAALGWMRYGADERIKCTDLETPNSSN